MAVVTIACVFALSMAVHKELLEDTGNEYQPSTGRDPTTNRHYVHSSPSGPPSPVNHLPWLEDSQSVNKFITRSSASFPGPDVKSQGPLNGIISGKNSQYPVGPVLDSSTGPAINPTDKARPPMNGHPVGNNIGPLNGIIPGKISQYPVGPVLDSSTGPAINPTDKARPPMNGHTVENNIGPLNGIIPGKNSQYPVGPVLDSSTGPAINPTDKARPPMNGHPVGNNIGPLNGIIPGKNSQYPVGPVHHSSTGPLINPTDKARPPMKVHVVENSTPICSGDISCRDVPGHAADMPSKELIR